MIQAIQVLRFHLLELEKVRVEFSLYLLAHHLSFWSDNQFPPLGVNAHSRRHFLGEIGQDSLCYLPKLTNPFEN